MYHLTHRMMISWSKCRPLNRSCAEVGSVIPADTQDTEPFSWPNLTGGRVGIMHFGLPSALKLNDFRVAYFSPPTLHSQTHINSHLRG